MAKIGIALGSGSAKGWAHIGVLKALAQLGVKPDVVAGCSVGAFVGAAYATDNLAELEQWVNGFSSWDLVSMLDISLRRGGLMSGEKVFEQAKSMIGDINVEDLELPFIAVATDLYGGNEVWLKRGCLQDVVRASCAIPGLLAPVRLGERYFIDGAVVNPIPINVCRALGADVVIAVDLYGYPEVVTDSHPVMRSGKNALKSDNERSHFNHLINQSRDYFNDFTKRFVRSNRSELNMFAVMTSALEILEYRQKKSRLAGDPPEVLIQPQVAHIGSMEFNRASESILAGEQAVYKIKHLIESELVRIGR
ncbi:MAG: patatin-like phospholipase RssA [Gammaproteobacteria bacterium]|nr:patatin-like phospholipase RssA [Gammaproteobacteria bacterium]